MFPDTYVPVPLSYVVRLGFTIDKKNPRKHVEVKTICCSKS